jgi:hypothetical protein
MARTPERAVKDAVEKLLKAHKVWYFFPNMTGYGRAGIPDIIACVRGRFLAIECKAGKGQTTALQDRELERIEDSGGFAIVIREDNLDVLEQILEFVK